MSQAPEFKQADLDAWHKAAAKSAPGGDVQALNWVTPDGITVKPLYTAADLQGLPHADTLPGFEPFIRGPQATMYAVRPWTIRQYAGFSTAEESNAFYRKALAAGGQGAFLGDGRLTTRSAGIRLHPARPVDHRPGRRIHNRQVEHHVVRAADRIARLLGHPMEAHDFDL